MGIFSLGNSSCQPKCAESRYLSEQQDQKITELFTNDVCGKPFVVGFPVLPAPFTLLTFTRGFC